MTDRYAVIGNPVAHSRSPTIHQLFAAQCAQDLEYSTLLAPLDGFAATVQRFVADGGRGLNVTLPFKQEAFRLATGISARAHAAAAVNTLKFDDGQILADNTDGAGLVRDLTANLGCTIGGKRILLLGAGGAARGVINPLCSEGPARLQIANRTVDKARRLVGEFATAALPIAGCGFADLAGSSFDLIINATSASLSDASVDLPANLFAPGAVAYDMVYGRASPFMRQAQAAGATQVVDGLGMLVEQAAESFLWWRGVRPDTAPVLRRLRQELAAR